LKYKDIVFRNAVEQDVLTAVEIIRARCIWMKENGINQWNDEYLKYYNEKYFSQKAVNGELYIAEYREKPIGIFVLLEKDKRWDDDVPAYYLHNFAVLPQAKGAGEMIIQYCEKRCRADKKERLRLDCGINNKILNNYYESKGFLSAGICDESPYYIGIKREKNI